MNMNTMSLQVECTYFFEENPYAMETVQSLATRLGRSAEYLEAVLQELVSLTILSRVGAGEESIYRYNQPLKVEGKLEEQWKGA